jgi:hypothetical protein
LLSFSQVNCEFLLSLRSKLLGREHPKERFLHQCGLGKLYADGRPGRARPRGKACSALQFCPMMTREEQITLWSSTYKAALTGLLASKMHQLDRFSAHNVSVVTEQCKAFADQAVKDVAQYDRDMPNP